MKQLLLNPLLCTLALGLVLQSAYAQKKKNTDRVTIIENGDTTVNGVKLENLDRTERDRLKKEFKDPGRRFRADVFIQKNGPREDVVIKRFGGLPADTSLITEFDIRLPLAKKFYGFKRDADSVYISMERDSLFDRLARVPERMPVIPPGDFSIRIPNALSGREFSDRRFAVPGALPNSQTFSYNNTDKDGFSTRLNIVVGHASKSELKRITGQEQVANTLQVDDLTLFPNFSTGRMTLSFNLPTKGNTSVVVSDTEGKVIFSDKTAGSNGSYLKQLSMPRNGIYFIAIQQNNKWFVRKIMKE